MSAAPNPSPLTPEHLLQMVRKASQRFQKRDLAVPVEEGKDSPLLGEKAFAPRNMVKAIEEPVPEPEPEAPEPPEVEEAPPENAGFTPAPPPKTIDLEEERKAAFDAGFAEGLLKLDKARAEAREEAIAEMRAQLEAEVMEARDAFASALARFASAEHEMLEGLTQKLELAIRTLAAKRAGQRIEEAPQPFLRKIEKMVREVATGIEGTSISMNPADLVAVQPFIKNVSPLSKAKLSPDPKLGRGDLRIKMGDITFSDIMAERLSGGLG